MPKPGLDAQQYHQQMALKAVTGLTVRWRWRSIFAEDKFPFLAVYIFNEILIYWIKLWFRRGVIYENAEQDTSIPTCFHTGMLPGLFDPVCSSETSVGFQRTTRRYIPEESTPRNGNRSGPRDVKVSVRGYLFGEWRS
jgi:hypothetical protein